MGIIYDADDHPEWLGCWIELRTKSVTIGLPFGSPGGDDDGAIELNYTEVEGVLEALKFALEHRRDKKQESP